jgi:acetyl esterase/lipase
VPFFPPTDFLQMNAWYVDHPEVTSFINHDAPFSPESLLVGCPIQTCPSSTQAANPITYVEGDEVPMLILHGESDPLVPNGQSVLLYEALTGAGNGATFISVPAAGHSVDQIIGAEDFTVFRTNRGGQEQVTTEPAPTWENVEHFIHVALSRARGG